jgi:hypothetical protein
VSKLLYRIIPWTVILLPFLILGILYNSLSADIIIFAHLDGSFDYAPKSLFTVFRVPLIEVVCGLAIEIMRLRASGVETLKSYYRMWTILLYTVAAKTLLQAVEMISARDRGRIFFYITLGVVILGIVSAVFTGRGAFSGFKRGEWKLGLWEIPALVGLLIGYLVLALAPQF